MDDIDTQKKSSLKVSASFTNINQLISDLILNNFDAYFENDHDMLLLQFGSSLHLELEKHVNELDKIFVKLGAALCITKPKDFYTLQSVVDNASTVLTNTVITLCKVVTIAGAGNTLYQRLVTDTNILIDALQALDLKLQDLYAHNKEQCDNCSILGPMIGRILTSCKGFLRFPFSVNEAVNAKLLEALALLRDTINELKEQQSEQEEEAAVEIGNSVYSSDTLKECGNESGEHSKMAPTKSTVIMDSDTSLLDDEYDLVGRELNQKELKVLVKVIESLMVYIKELILLLTRNRPNQGRKPSKQGTKILDSITQYVSQDIPKSIDLYCTHMYTNDDTLEQVNEILKLQNILQITRSNILNELEKLWPSARMVDVYSADEVLKRHLNVLLKNLNFNIIENGNNGKPTNKQVDTS